MGLSDLPDLAGLLIVKNSIIGFKGLKKASCSGCYLIVDTINYVHLLNSRNIGSLIPELNVLRACSHRAKATTKAK